MKKKVKVLSLIVLVLLAILISVSIYFHFNPSIAVLGYHSFYDPNDSSENINQFVLNLEKFDQQMKYLKNHHFKTLTLDEFYCWKQNQCDFPRKTVLITMDDGYVSNYKYAFDVLKKYDLKATVFFIGAYTPNTTQEEEAYMSFETINNAKKEYPNIEFASHSFNMHGDENVTNMSKERIEEDIKKFKSISDTKYIAYPEGKYNEDFINSLKENGYNLGFGFGPVYKKATRKDNDFDIHRFSITGDLPFWKYKLRIFIPY